MPKFNVDEFAAKYADEIIKKAMDEQAETVTKGETWLGEDAVMDVIAEGVHDKWAQEYGFPQTDEEVDAAGEAMGVIMQMAKQRGGIFETMSFPPAALRVRMAARLRAMSAMTLIAYKDFNPEKWNGVVNAMKAVKDAMYNLLVLWEQLPYGGPFEALETPQYPFKLSFDEQVAEMGAWIESVEEQGMPAFEGAKMTEKGQEKVSKDISKYMKHGKPQKQAVAIALSKARKAGYKGAEKVKASAQADVEELLDMTFPNWRELIKTDPEIKRQVEEFTAMLDGFRKQEKVEAAKATDTFTAFEATLKARTGLTAADAGITDQAAWEKVVKVVGSNKWISNLIAKHGLNDLAASTEFDWVPMEQFGGFFAVENGTIYSRPMMEDGTSDKDYVEVTAPESQEFLDAINKQFGTSFKMDQFAGR